MRCNFKTNMCGWTYESKTPSLVKAHRHVMERYQWQYGLALFLSDVQLMSPVYAGRHSADACLQLNVYDDNRDGTGQFPLKVWLMQTATEKLIPLVLLHLAERPLIYAVVPSQCNDFRFVIEATLYMTLSQVELMSGDECTSSFEMAPVTHNGHVPTESMRHEPPTEHWRTVIKYVSTTARPDSRMTVINYVR